MVVVEDFKYYFFIYKIKINFNECFLIKFLCLYFKTVNNEYVFDINCFKNILELLKKLFEIDYFLSRRFQVKKLKKNNYYLYSY